VERFADLGGHEEREIERHAPARSREAIDERGQRGPLHQLGEERRLAALEHDEVVGVDDVRVADARASLRGARQGAGGRVLPFGGRRLEHLHRHRAADEVIPLEHAAVHGGLAAATERRHQRQLPPTDEADRGLVSVRVRRRRRQERRRGSHRD
jgi:hypothetical protein